MLSELPRVKTDLTLFIYCGKINDKDSILEVDTK